MAMYTRDKAIPMSDRLRLGVTHGGREQAQYGNQNVPYVASLSGQKPCGSTATPATVIMSVTWAITIVISKF